MSRPHATAVGGWRAQAVAHWLTGVIFALVLSLVLSLLGPATPGLRGLLRDVEARGVDAAMRARLVLSGPPQPSAVSPGFVFLDVDPKACRDAGLTTRCDSRSPAAPGLVADLATAALAADPKLVVIDVDLWEVTAGEPSAHPSLSRLAAAAKAHPRSPVVAVAPFRPTGSERRGVLDASLIPPELIGAARFAPSFVWPGDAESDGVLRRYPATAKAAPPGSKAAGDPVPTLPRLAADLAGATPSPKLDEPDTRLLFVFPSLVPPDDQHRAPEAARFQRIYDRYPASAAMAPDGRLALDASLLSGRIVVISTSAETALDRHNTPLGEMAGAEVLVNAIQAFLTDGVVREASLPRRLQQEALVVAAASLPFLAFWLAWFGLAPRLRRKALAWALPVAAGVGFAAAVLVGMGLAALTTLASLGHGFQQGFALEFFTPIFALSLEGFAEGARWLLDRIEPVAAGLTRLVADRLGGAPKGDSP